MVANNGERRRVLRRLFIILGVILVAAIVFAGGVFVGNYKHVGNFFKVYSIIQSEYLEPVGTTELVDGAIKGMVESLDDPYSAYLDPQTYSHLQEQIRGSFGGLGILVGVEEDYLTVVRTFEDTPAEKGGIKAGDRIVKINGEDARGMDLETAVGIMRGPVGSQLTLTLERENKDEPIQITLTREEISVPTVEGRMLNGTRIAHVTITQFNEKTPGELNNTLEELKEDGMEAIILDLRNNPGGELMAAKEVSDRFLPQGPIVTVDYRSGQDHTFESDKEYLDIPVVVLINGSSASASEIVAGAIKDTGMGTLVGTTTFGKGVVQTVFPLDNGAALKLTTARYLTPDNHNINEKGIEPDVKVEQPEESSRDRQLEKAKELIQEDFSASAMDKASGQ